MQPRTTTQRMLHLPSRRTLVAALTVPAFAIAAACGGDKAPASDSAAGSMAATSDTMAMRDSTGGAMAAGPNNAGMMDPAIAQFIAAVNAGEVDAGKLASTKGRNADVKAYGQQMVKEHQDAMTKLSALPGAAGWMNKSDSSMSMGSGTPSGTRTDSSGGTAMAGAATATPGPLAAKIEQVEASNKQTKATLQGLSGAAFDKAYIDAQAMGHQMVLDVLKQYSTTVQNSDLRTYVMDVQRHVEEHLGKAKDLQQKMGAM